MEGPSTSASFVTSPGASTSSVATSPEYFSCEENDELKDLFVAKISYQSYEKKTTIDYFLKDAIDYSNFDSEMTIAAFNGCIRIGKVIYNNLLNEKEAGLNKDNLIEIPIFLIPKFVTELYNSITYLIKNKIQSEIVTEIGEVRHRLFLFSKKITQANLKLITFFIKKTNSISYEIVFSNLENIKYFSQQIFNLVLDTTYPMPYQQDFTILLLKKLETKPEKLICNLYSFWEKKQKLEILWNAISEVIFEQKKKEEKQLTILTFNFIKKHISLIQAMQKLYKIAQLK